MNFTKICFSALVCIFLFLNIVTRLVVSQTDEMGYNWKRIGYDDQTTFYNPQQAFNKDNLDEITQTWMTSLSKEPGFFGNETARTTSNLLLVNGYIYLIDRGQILLALNSENSNQVWSEVLSISNPERYGLEDVYVHSHLLNYFEQMVWLIDLDCSIKGFKAYNGEPLVEIPPQVLCGDIPSDAKPRDTAYRAVSAPILFEREKVMIATPSGFGTEDTSLSYIVGISLETQNIVWKTPFVINDEDNLNIGIGPWSIDQEAGIVYIGTGAPIPEWNSTRRGDNPYSNSIIALDAANGEILWYYQTTPHDINGYGCTNNILLGEIDGRKTVFAACRNGYLYSLDAKTGDLLWYFDPPAVKRINSENADFVKTGTYDSEKLWINYPATEPVIQCPGIFGAAPFNIALGYSTIYMATFNSCSRLQVAPVKNVGDTGVQNITKLYEPVGPVNSTIYAVDASTGDEKWSQFFDGGAIKGGVTVSGHAVFLPMPNGNLYALDADTGSLLWERYFGALGLAIPPVIGTTARGNWTLIQVVAGTPLLERSLDQLSGFMFAFSLPSEWITTTVDETSSPDYSILLYAAGIVTIFLLVGIFLIYNARRTKT